jgi:choline dehydrogenase-like flavoprotein
VLTGALVMRLVFDGKRAVGVEFLREGQSYRVAAHYEIVLSLGVINTPKVLMQSGIGDKSELSRVGIHVVHHLPGVGRNFQDHVLTACIWEYKIPLAPRNNAAEATFFWKSDMSLNTPDLQPIQVEFPFSPPETANFSPPAASWSLLPGIVRPSSKGQLRLTGPSPSDPIEIVANTFSDSIDVKALIRSVELCREIGNSGVMSRFVKREVFPGSIAANQLESFVRATASTYYHPTSTTKMGRDDMSVVDSRLRVYGIDNLRVADASIMPRVTTGNTMAPCVVIGEKVAAFLREKHAI